MIGLALSGGGSRAIAFHLGCLRALHERDVLERVELLSGVSGGAIIGALYAYRDVPFEQFDADVVALLRRGLHRAILEEMFSPRNLSGIVLTNLVARPTAFISRMLGKPPPWRRWRSRTDAFEAVLARPWLFGSTRVDEVARPNLRVVINACELRTGTAFRWGSFKSGSWRIGEEMGGTTTVAHAVAASAAYPLLLPAFDRMARFESEAGTHRYRTVIADGGIYDNLGITVMKPAGDGNKSLFQLKVDSIISCSAGYGAMDDRQVPFGLISRIARATDVTFKKSQDALIDRLHIWAETGQIRGFVFSYLGQDDSFLPEDRSDYIRRDIVCNYPTNFAAMPEVNVHRISLRGEQLTRLWLSRYCPWL